MKDVPEAECKAFLRRHRVGVMALANGGEAYAVPLFYAYDGYNLYFNSRAGDKDAFIEGTTEGCFVVVEVHGDDDWTSVEAKGKVERVHTNEEADRALRAIAENPFPPEFGVTPEGKPERSSKGAYLWMMKPRKVTGRSSRSLIRVK